MLRKNLVWLAYSTLAMLFMLLVACSESAPSDELSTDSNMAKELYEKKCSICHGLNGDTQLSGAKKLTLSTITQSDIETMVTEGLRQMPSFKTQLSPKEIVMVSEYAYSFRSK